MAVSTSPFVVGEKVTAAKLNAYQAAIAELQAFNNRAGVSLVPSGPKACNAGTTTTIDNLIVNGSDPYGFYDAVNAATYPIKVPVGMGGLYLFRIRASSTVTSSGRAFTQAFFAGTPQIERVTWAFDNGATYGFPKILAAGDRIGLQQFTSTTGNFDAPGELAMYRIGL